MLISNQQGVGSFCSARLCLYRERGTRAEQTGPMLGPVVKPGLTGRTNKGSPAKPQLPQPCVGWRTEP